MMRCVAMPTMVKDGSGWGAFAGVTAAFLAAAGYTGAPAVTLEEDRVAGFWSDLGERWRLLEQYVKPYPVCRWAQPAMEAVRALQAAHRFAPDDVAKVEIRGFREAVALGTREPRTTEEAQYSLPFPVAAMIVRGKLGASEVFGRALRDPAILRLTRSMALTEWPEFSRRFPAERWSQVTVTLNDGTTLVSAPSVARGSAENPLGSDEIRAKFRDLATPALGRARAAAIERAIDGIAAPKAPLKPLLNLLLKPPR
jgi:2-methylcitrate dehydratase PrpD